VADKQQSQRAAQTKKDKAIFFFGVIRIVDQLGSLVDKYGSSLFEADAVLLRICRSLPFVPLEAKHPAV
jgi:hypothetical protein